MKQETYSSANEGERYQNPWWLPFLAVFLAACALLIGRFMADHYVKPALPRESVLAARLQSEEGQNLLNLVSDQNVCTLLLHFVSGEIQAAFDKGYIPGPEDLRVLAAAAGLSHQNKVSIGAVEIGEEGISLTGTAPGPKEADAFLLGMQNRGFSASYQATDPGETFRFTVFLSLPRLEETYLFIR